jgi:hypothetical protein
MSSKACPSLRFWFAKALSTTVTAPLTTLNIESFSCLLRNWIWMKQK